MKTTLNLNDEVLRRARESAAKSGVTLTRFVEDALRAKLVQRSGVPFRLKLVTVGGTSAPNIDITDRDALYDLIDRR